MLRTSEKLTGEQGNLKHDVISFLEQQAIEKQIAALELKLRKEIQPHRKFELHQQIQKLKKSLL